MLSKTTLKYGLHAVLPSKPCQANVQTVQKMYTNYSPWGKYSSFFLYFRIFAIFYKYMKNKIGILENDIYLFPIVNSVILLFVKCTVFAQMYSFLTV